MKRAEIEAYIEKKQKASDRNYMAYQETGIGRYMREHERLEDEIQIARQALAAADDHAAVSTLKVTLFDICSRAIRILNTNDDPSGLLKDLQAIGKLQGVSNPWE